MNLWIYIEPYYCIERDFTIMMDDMCFIKVNKSIMYIVIKIK